MSEKVDVLKVEDHILEEVAKKIDTTVNSLDKDVMQLEEWLRTQPHLPNMLDRHSLRNFLLLNKCSIEKTKQKIDNYYTIRSKLQDIFKEINPKYPYHKKFDDMAYVVPSNGLTDQMYKVCFFKVKNQNLMEYFEPLDLIRKLWIIQEMRLREDVMYGDIFVVDCKGVTLSVVLKLTPMVIYRGIVTIYEQVFSLRCKGVYLINFPSFGEKVVALAKSFLKPKLTKRIYIYENIETIKKIVPLHMIPKEFGGEGLSLDVLQASLQAKCEEHQLLFDLLDKAKVDESLRPEKLKNDDIMGFHGNFKKLDID